MQPKYKRILLKLSGEALAGDQKFGLNHEVIAGVVDQIVQIHNMGVEVGLVIAVVLSIFVPCLPRQKLPPPITSPTSTPIL